MIASRLLRAVNVWEERPGRNEGLFREINASIARSDEGSGSDSFPAFCECALIECETHIEVGFSDFTRVRRSPHRFIVAPGHEQPAIEQVVEDHEPD